MKNNSEIWFSDSQTEGASLNIRVTNQLYHAVSEFQEIDVFQSESFGKFLVLDGEVIFSEADEFIYNEMVVHVPMAVHPNVKRVLIIGGGDGGVASGFTAYSEIEHIDVVEPDEQMVDVCKKFFPDTTKGFGDERVEVSYQDGLRFVRSRENEYDIIINDATDPFGHAEGLFTKEFYGSCFKALKSDGIMVYQHGSPFFDDEESIFRSMHRKVYRTFPISRVYQAHIPTCSSGYWTFGFASKKYHPIEDFDPERWSARNIETWYYTPQMHRASFMLPQYVVDILHEEEGKKGR